MKRFVLASLIVLAFCGRNYACGHVAAAAVVTPAIVTNVVTPAFVAVTPAVVSNVAVANVAVTPAVVATPAVAVATPFVAVATPFVAVQKVKVRGGRTRVEVRVR